MVKMVMLRSLFVISQLKKYDSLPGSLRSAVVILQVELQYSIFKFGAIIFGYAYVVTESVSIIRVMDRGAIDR